MTVPNWTAPEPGPCTLCGPPLLARPLQEGRWVLINQVDPVLFLTTADGKVDRTIPVDHPLIRASVESYRRVQENARAASGARMGHGLTILSADATADRIYLLVRSMTVDGSATVLELDALSGNLVGERKLVLSSGSVGAKSTHLIEATDSAVLLASFDGAVFAFRR